jgi:hypothetical protein
MTGSDVEIAAEIENPAHKAYPATLYLRREGEPETAVPMLANETNERFVTTLPQLNSPLRYRLQIGDSQTGRFTLGVQPRPSVADVAVTYHYPAYLERPRETATQKHGDLDAPQFTVAELAIHPVTPIARGHLQTERRQVPGVVLDGGRTLLAYLLLEKSTTYTVHLFTEAGQTDPEPRVNQVRVVPDAPPTVQVVQPAGESSGAPGGTVSITVRAGDDHGLGLVRVEMKRGEDPAAKPVVEPVASWDRFCSSRSRRG